MTFQCKKCRYKFDNRDPGRKDPPKNCPWCNSANTVVLIKTADEIVKEVDDLVRS